jgi:hypothetical protein
MLRLSREWHVKGVHPQCVNVEIRKIASVENDRLETYVRSPSSGMDAIGSHEVLLGLLVLIVPILMSYRVTFSTAAIMASSLAGVRTVRGGPAFTCAAAVTFPVLQRHCYNRRNTLASG